MKKFLAAGLLAVALLASTQQQASAWINSRFSIGLNWQFQSGNNCLLWGLFSDGQVPGPEYFQGQQGYGHHGHHGHGLGLGIGHAPYAGMDYTSNYQQAGYGYPSNYQQAGYGYTSPYQLMSYPGAFYPNYYYQPGR